MDDTDRSIVSLLLADGRMSHEQIAKEIHLSRPAVFERIKRLEVKGVIRGYGAKVDWEALGLPLTAFVWIRTGSGNCDDCGRQIAEVRLEGMLLEDLHRVTGEWCFFAKYRLGTPTVLQQVIDRVRQVPGVQNTLTTIALSAVAQGSPTNGHAARSAARGVALLPAPAT
jgi:Lrp/AsnC family leucine-responsive transcriptional regulator